MGKEFGVGFFEDWEKLLSVKVEGYKVVHLTMDGGKIGGNNKEVRKK